MNVEPIQRPCLKKGKHFMETEQEQSIRIEQEIVLQRLREDEGHDEDEL